MSAWHAPAFLAHFGDPYLRATPFEFGGNPQALLATLGAVAAALEASENQDDRLPFVLSGPQAAFVRDVLLPQLRQCREWTEKGLKVQDAKQLQTFLHEWRAFLHAIPLRTPTLIPGGYVGNESSHSMLYVLEKTGEELYSFTVCNKGPGAEMYHRSTVDDPSTSPDGSGNKCEKIRVQPFVQITQIPAARCLDMAFWTLLFSLWVRKPASEYHRVEVIYDVLLPWLAGDRLLPLAMEDTERLVAQGNDTATLAALQRGRTPQRANMGFGKKDDIMHLDRLPTFQGTLSSEEAEYLLSYLTVPYARHAPTAVLNPLLKMLVSIKELGEASVHSADASFILFMIKVGMDTLRYTTFALEILEQDTLSNTAARDALRHYREELLSYTFGFAWETLEKWRREAEASHDLQTACVIHSYMVLLNVALRPTEYTPERISRFIGSIAFVRNWHCFGMKVSAAVAGDGEGSSGSSLSAEERLLRWLQAQGVNTENVSKNSLEKYLKGRPLYLKMGMQTIQAPSIVAMKDGEDANLKLPPAEVLERKVNWSARSLLLDIARANPPFHALIDTGALITGFENHEVAAFLLEHLPTEMEGVVFLDQDDRQMILLRDHNAPMPLVQCGLSPTKRFTFYDQVHTTGMDIKQCVNARAVLTLGKDMTFRDYAQGAYRMRDIDQADMRLTAEVVHENEQEAEEEAEEEAEQEEQKMTQLSVGIQCLRFFNNEMYYTPDELELLLTGLENVPITLRYEFFECLLRLRRRERHLWGDTPLAKAFTEKDEWHLLSARARMQQFQQSLQRKKGKNKLHLATALRRFDENCDGHLSAEEVLKCFESFQLGYSSGELSEIIGLIAEPKAFEVTSAEGKRGVSMETICAAFGITKEAMRDALRREDEALAAQSGQGGSHWSCPVCTFRNDGAATACGACNEPNPALMEDTEAAGASQQGWQCANCTFINLPTDVACAICELGVDGQRAVPRGKWVCAGEQGGCTYFNAMSNFYCEVCNRARPDLASVKF
ncbi:hypothetical protein P43SY_005197 [Pythium insidiosum]|uniref:ubiquitinyl hydrolase 1 n=1 Tax=Pythium insidiosum TaxID=114742 RepID=A0AAD5LQI6_PYTIN|nr:hypothetical protein P43SY_005197 [Pythium insidiosum]